jgi:cathepsin B
VSIKTSSNYQHLNLVTTASVLQDRRCVVYNATETPISAWDLVTCCADCIENPNNGCDGGFPTDAFDYFAKTGLVTGGMYGSGSGCKPYPIAPNATGNITSTTCSATCEPSYTTPYASDKKKGSSYKVFSKKNTAVMQEIYARGSVVASFTIYEDFFHYSTGVYKHSTGKQVGGKCVTSCLGWILWEKIKVFLLGCRKIYT